MIGHILAFFAFAVFVGAAIPLVLLWGRNELQG